MHHLILVDQVFAIVGNVGTPTSKVALPIAVQHGLPFVGAFTGASFLREPFQRYVLNYRASYADEAGSMIETAVEHFYFSKISIFYQDDSFGLNGLQGAEAALRDRRLKIHSRGTYPRGTVDVEAGLARMAEESDDPEFVILVGTARPVAKFVKAAKKIWSRTFFCAVSFVGSAQLAAELGSAANRRNVYVTQVVESPNNTAMPLVSDYQQALLQSDASAMPDFTSLEGYIVGRFLAKTMSDLWRTIPGLNLSNISNFSGLREG
ncbi:unnamed protein product, partial [Polarella glacialis]